MAERDRGWPARMPFCLFSCNPFSPEFVDNHFVRIFVLLPHLVCGGTPIDAIQLRATERITY